MCDKIQHQLIDRGGHKSRLKVHINEPFSVPVVTEDACMRTMKSHLFTKRNEWQILSSVGQKGAAT